MARDLSPISLVALPRLSASGTVVLSKMIKVAAAEEKRLPKGIATALLAVEKRHGTLSAALQAQLAAAAAPPDTKAADGDEDNGVGAVYDFLSAWARLPEETYPQVAVAKRALATLFPTGTGFLRAEYAVEWAEVNRRIERMQKDGIDTQIGKLGGEPFVEHLLAVHAAYGKALGITEKSSEGRASDAGIADPLRELQAALRIYVVKVVAHIDADDPESEALAARLLAPIAEYESRLAGPNPAPGSEEPEPKNDPAAPSPPSP